MVQPDTTTPAFLVLNNHPVVRTDPGYTPIDVGTEGPRIYLVISGRHKTAQWVAISGKISTVKDAEGPPGDAYAARFLGLFNN